MVMITLYTRQQKKKKRKLLVNDLLSFEKMAVMNLLRSASDLTHINDSRHRRK